MFPYLESRAHRASSCALVLASLSCGPVWAQSTTTVAPVVVTASRAAESLANALAHTSVITRADIERLGSTDVLSLLRREASVDIAQNGHAGSVSSIFLRGAESRQTLVLIDGHRAGSATIGATALEQLAVDQIDRIEIVRGNVSSLYGANAMGGVINVITRKGAGAASANVHIGVGSHDAQRLAAGLGAGADDWSARVDLSRHQSGGVSAIDASRFATVNPDRDGYRNQSANVSMGYRLAPGFHASASWLEARGNVEFDNAFARLPSDTHRADNRVNVASAALDVDRAGAVTSRFSIASGRDVSDNATNGVRASKFETQSDQISWSLAYRTGAFGTLTGGVESLKEQVDATTRFVSLDRRVTSIRAQWAGAMQSHQWHIAARHDDYSDVGSAGTGLVSYGFRASPALRWVASFANAFAAPTFNQLYFPGFGNPKLMPEKSRSVELGAEWSNATQHTRVQVFRTQYQDLIASGPPSFLPENVSQARVTGVELSHRGEWGPWLTRASITLQNPKNLVSGQQLLRRPKQKASGELHYTLGRWSMGAIGDWVGQRQDRTLTTSQQFTAASYALLHAHARYQAAPTVQLALRLENLTDKAYETAAGYAMPRRGVFASVTWSPHF